MTAILSTFLFPLSTIIIRQLFRLTDTGNDVLHMLNGDGLHARSLQLGKQLGNTLFDVVGNLFSTLFLTEGGTQRLRVVLQHLVGILINLEEAPAQVNGNILLHIID